VSQVTPCDSCSGSKVKQVHCSLFVGSTLSRRRSFFTKVGSVCLSPNQPVSFNISFLPTRLGRHQCSLILTDDAVGEMLYLVKGIGALPEPECVPVGDCATAAHSARVTTASATGTSTPPYVRHVSVVIQSSAVGCIYKLHH